ncbi:hypothetical protein P280DRAFT_197574 [Massarina eburnea CBS 473.64]|uniref:Uncharacterized protein n=1 Tax=Massarina eburnea CBS 473.64 TaxID=1395130 RepID=A0A6A6RJ60_9PLEO|nr:hypothetical protein P280DRAFT_197574 [Massarina eburnea CBS 473.64]
MRWLSGGRQEAERESAKHQQNASKGTKRRGNAKEHRYELLTQTRDINIAIKNIDNEISANINAYSQAKMLSFSQEMLVRLPREVRDLVYENLMDRVCKRKNDITLYMDHRRQPKKMWADKPSVFPFTNDWVKKPFHYEDSDYVGIEFARELVEMYYRKTTFHLRDSSLSILGTWLRQDPFGYDLVVHRNLCHLTLQIDFRSPGPHRCYA